MSWLLQDLSSSLRSLIRRPFFSVSAVAMLAIGLGSTGAVFTLLDALLFRPLDIREPSRFVRLTNSRPDVSNSIPFSYAMWQRLRDSQSSFESLFAWAYPAMTVEIDGSRERVGGLIASGQVFETLGVGASAGRILTSQDDGEPVVALSHDFWRRRFGADPSVIGKTIRVSWRPYTIVGVAAEGFTCLQPGVPCEMIVPLDSYVSAEPAVDWRGRRLLWLEIHGRLKDGVSIEKARAELSVLWPSILDETIPVDAVGDRETRFRSQTISVEPASRGSSRYQRVFADPLYVLGAIVTVLLLIISVNIANLMLAHATSRRRETAVRLAIGASKGRVLSQVALESLWLAAGGAALGLAVSMFASRAIASFWNSDAGRLALDLRVDLRLFGFLAATAALAALLAGAAPALQAAFTSPLSAMKEGALNIAGRRSRLAATLISAQIAFSVCLLCGAGLLTRTLANLREQPLDFARDGVAMFALAPVPGGYGDRDLDTYYRDLIEEVRAIPGVASAAVASNAPMDVWPSPGPVKAESPRAAPSATATSSCVSPELFRTVETRMLAGRPFDWSDRTGRQDVAIVNETLARDLFGAADPLGERIGFGLEPSVHNRRIVGVVQDRGYRGFRDADAASVYVPCAQRGKVWASGYLTLVVRSAGPTDRVIEAVKQRVEGIGVEYPIRILTMRQRLRQALVRERALAAVSTAVGAIALLLVAVGLYAVVAYTVRTQRREIGVRMAVGADRKSILAWVMRHTLGMTLAGLAVGLPLASFGSRYLQSVLFGVAPADILTAGMAVAAAAGASLLAALAPAAQAASVQPMDTLRED